MDRVRGQQLELECERRAAYRRNMPAQPVVGRGERIRTSDHRNPIAVRYQTALRPV